ncbi:MAG: hypothetical protein F6K35_28910 [Okeania sp. SIO2H7]|nr:hypothetical protein [Okeania sp. SIO2H7]
MKQTIVVLGLIASTGSLFLLPNKTLAETVTRSRQTETTMAFPKAIAVNNTKEANYTGTNEDNEQEEIETGKSQAE